VKNDFPEMDKLKSRTSESLVNSALLMIVEEWLRQDQAVMRKKTAADQAKSKTKWEILSENMLEVKLLFSDINE
jgi:hypothetical protein